MVSMVHGRKKARSRGTCSGFALDSGCFGSRLTGEGENWLSSGQKEHMHIEYAA